MSQTIVNQEIISRAAAGFWVAMQDEFARERESSLRHGENDGESVGVWALPAMPAWQELPEPMRAALQRHLADAVSLSSLGYAAPTHDHYALERIWRWCEAINLRGLVCEAKTSFHRHKVYGKAAAVIMEMAADEGLIVHLGHLVIVLARYQARGEKPITEQDLISWKREPVVRALREQWHEDLGLMREAMVAAEQGKVGRQAKERRAV
jgi:hypothetical protein